MKKSCPRRDKILTQRRSKTTCFTCYCTGHYSIECDTEWIQPAERTPEQMTYDGLEGRVRKHVTHGDPVTALSTIGKDGICSDPLAD